MGRGFRVGGLEGEVRGFWGGAVGESGASRGPEVNSYGMEVGPHVCPEIAQLWPL